MRRWGIVLAAVVVVGAISAGLAAGIHRRKEREKERRQFTGGTPAPLAASINTASAGTAPEANAPPSPLPHRFVPPPQVFTHMVEGRREGAAAFGAHGTAAPAVLSLTQEDVVFGTWDPMPAELDPYVQRVAGRYEKLPTPQPVRSPHFMP